MFVQSESENIYLIKYFSNITHYKSYKWVNSIKILSRNNLTNDGSDILVNDPIR